MPAVVKISDGATRAELEEVITFLRAKQLKAMIPSTAREIGDEIDSLLDEWWSAPA